MKETTAATIAGIGLALFGVAIFSLPFILEYQDRHPHRPDPCTFVNAPDTKCFYLGVKWDHDKGRIYGWQCQSGEDIVQIVETTSKCGAP